jgi:hypothetical protein
MSKRDFHVNPSENLFKPIFYTLVLGGEERTAEIWALDHHIESVPNHILSAPVTLPRHRTNALYA